MQSEESKGAAQQLGVGIGDVVMRRSIIKSWYEESWIVKGLHTVSGDLYVERLGDLHTITAKNAKYWCKRPPAEVFVPGKPKRVK